MPDPQYLPRGTLRPRSSPSAAAAYQHELQSRAAAVSVDAAARSADVDAFIDTSIYPKGGGRCAWSPDGFRGPAVSRRGNASGASSFVVVPPLSAHTSVRKSKSREAQERERYNLSTRSSPSPPAAHGCRTRSGMNLRASVDDVPLRVVKSATLGLSCSRPPRLQQAEYSPRPLPSFGREPSSPFSPSGSLRSTESRTSHNASRGVYSVPIGDGCPQTWESLPQSQARLRSSRSQRDTSASCQQSALRNSTPLPVFEVGTKTPPETVALEDRIANEAAEEVSRRTRERKLQEFDMADTRRLAVSAERSARIFILHEHKVACNILYIVCIDSKRAAFEATESRIRSAVSKQQCQEALWLLADPDIRSITFDRQEADGRRVVAELEEQVCRQLNASRNRSWTAAFHAANVAPVVRRTLEEELSARMGIEEECARWVVTQTWVKAQKVKSRQHLLLKEKERRSVTVSERAVFISSVAILIDHAAQAEQIESEAYTSTLGTLLQVTIASEDRHRRDLHDQRLALFARESEHLVYLLSTLLEFRYRYFITQQQKDFSETAPVQQPAKVEDVALEEPANNSSPAAGGYKRQDQPSEKADFHGADPSTHQKPVEAHKAAVLPECPGDQKADAENKNGSPAAPGGKPERTGADNADFRGPDPSTHQGAVDAQKAAVLPECPGDLKADAEKKKGCPAAPGGKPERTGGATPLVEIAETKNNAVVTDGEQEKTDVTESFPAKGTDDIQNTAAAGEERINGAGGSTGAEDSDAYSDNFELAPSPATQTHAGTADRNAAGSPDGSLSDRRDTTDTLLSPEIEHRPGEVYGSGEDSEDQQQSQTKSSPAQADSRGNTDDSLSGQQNEGGPAPGRNGEQLDEPPDDESSCVGENENCNGATAIRELLRAPGERKRKAKRALMSNEVSRGEAAHENKSGGAGASRGPENTREMEEEADRAQRRKAPTGSALATVPLPKECEGDEAKVRNMLSFDEQHSRSRLAVLRDEEEAVSRLRSDWQVPFAMRIQRVYAVFSRRNEGQRALQHEKRESAVHALQAYGRVSSPLTDKH